MRKNLTMERVMKKIITLLALSLVLLSFGCKKDAPKETPKDNQTDNQTQVEKPKTDMEPFKKSLSVLKNPQYDLVYKLIEDGGINAQLDKDVTIGYPSHAKRLLIDEPQITIQKGATPLGIAALFCTPSLVNDLIEKGADLKAKTNGMEVSAIIIQCGEAEQAGMFENYLDKVRKFERDNPSIYKDKSELYAANAIIKENLTDEDGKGKTILNYAVENNLNDAIPVIIKYAGGINFTNRNDENNNQMPVITALKSKNYEALNFFFTKTASLYIDMKAEDGTDTNIINYIFYNDMGHLFQEANVPTDVLLNLVLNGYNQKGAGIPEIRELTKGGNILAETTEDMTIKTKKGEVVIPAGSNIAHIAAYLGYNYIPKGLSFIPDGVKAINKVSYPIGSDNGTLPLTIAVENGSPLAVKTLLESGADLANTTPYTPLNTLAHTEKVNNQAAIAKILMTSSALGSMAQLQELGEAEGIESVFQGTNQAVLKVVAEYAEPVRAASVTIAKEIFNGIEGGSKIARILDGGVNNQLPFAVEVNGVTIPKDATPLIAAALLCNSEAVDALIVGMADTDIRITGENDLKYNAYDFADRMAQGDCTAVKASLKNPANVKPHPELNERFYNKKENMYTNGRMFLEESSVNQAPQESTESTETVIDENTTVEEAPADNTNSESDADVELVIEE